MPGNNSLLPGDNPDLPSTKLVLPTTKYQLLGATEELRCMLRGSRPVKQD